MGRQTQIIGSNHTIIIMEMSTQVTYSCKFTPRKVTPNTSNLYYYFKHEDTYPNDTTSCNIVIQCIIQTTPTLVIILYSIILKLLITAQLLNEEVSYAQSREPEFESSGCRFETWTVLFTPRCSSFVYSTLFQFCLLHVVPVLFTPRCSSFVYSTLFQFTQLYKRVPGYIL